MKHIKTFMTAYTKKKSQASRGNFGTLEGTVKRTREEIKVGKRYAKIDRMNRFAVIWKRTATIKPLAE